MDVLGSFECYERTKKQESLGTLTLSKESLFFQHKNSSKCTKHGIKNYTAHRQHAKQPMIQLRFTTENGVEDVTFVFRDDEKPRLDLLKEFITLFTNIFKLLNTRESFASNETKTFFSPASSKLTSGPSNVLPAFYSTTSDKKESLSNKTTETQDLSCTTDKILKEQCSEIRKKNPYLNKSYQQLVEKGILSEQSFWKDYQMELELFKQETPGIESHSDFFNITNTMDTKRITVDAQQLTPKVKEDILKEFRAIADLHTENVPYKMSEDHFWNLFIQSRLFFELLELDVPSIADTSFFPSLETIVSSSKPPIHNALELEQCVPYDINLVASEDLVRPGYGTLTGRGALVGDMSCQPYRRHKNFFIIDRLNNHSATLLERTNTTLETDTITGPSVANDLVCHEERPFLPLEFSSSKDNRNSCYDDTNVLHQQFLDTLNCLMETCEMQTDALSSGEAKFIFLLNTKLIQKRLVSEDRQKLESILQQEEIRNLLSQVVEHQMKLRELLHAFWISDTPQIERQTMLATAIEATMNEINTVSASAITVCIQFGSSDLFD
ncbi:general transcription factor IIH subunit 1-like isoform X2 [Hylaeus volcanicus]|uniref:general transcription factor IIH subunit 1-like isoform X2 n=1 Tax=Hylaeus volcanicus TaxID=313075 RepID=UPI0023B8408C|nr:general transcription factor IIH subunit 1-like isoform X2 [Hylaeus volcanicus]